MHYITKGKGTYHFQDKTVQLKQGDLFLLCPDELTTYQADEKEPWSYYWFGISGRKSKEYFSYSEILETKYITDEASDTRKIGELLSTTLEYTEKIKGNHIHSEMYYLSMVHSVLYELSNTFPTQSDTITTDRTSVISQLAKQIIEKRYKEDISIQSIADELNISRSYLSKNFQSNYQISPKGYLMEIRMERAKQLLTITDEPVSIIGNSVGYQDSLIFSRAFKTYYGISPTNYRKETEDDTLVFKYSN